MRRCAALLFSLLLVGCGSDGPPGLRLFTPIANSEEADGRLPIAPSIIGQEYPIRRKVVVPPGESVLVLGVAALQPRPSLLAAWPAVESGWINVDPGTGFRA